jgi:hypothetical protein
MYRRLTIQHAYFLGLFLSNPIRSAILTTDNHINIPFLINAEDVSSVGDSTMKRTSSLLSNRTLKVKSTL